ncbi:MAG: threonine ammonia-lyase [Xanthomonadales bacterium]|jgi:threonine dehydratase|nr:threonine ammonia-lyase [Xanthomonadales bacterium]
MTVTLESIHDTARRLSGHVVRTPCHRSETLSAITGAEIYLKFENQQFTASFKDRGALAKLLSLDEAQRRRGVIAMSAGNHAQGVAHHATRMGIPATIVMPVSAPFNKVQQTRRLGATVVQHGMQLADAEIRAHEIAVEQGLVFVHPYDDETVIAGQGTVALEMLEDHPDIDCLCVPIGGGGLLAGMAIAARGIKPSIGLIGVQTRAFPAMHAAIAGTTPQFATQTIAEGIAVRNVGRITREIIGRLVEDILLVDESDIENAISLLISIEKTVAEGAGAAGLAAVLTHPDRFRGRKVGIVICGGNIDTRLLGIVLQRQLVREQRLVTLRFEITDLPGTLGRIAGLIGESGANIIDVTHHRLFLDVPAKAADLDFTIETRDAEHTAAVEAALHAAGLMPRRLSSSGS